MSDLISIDGIVVNRDCKIKWNIKSNCKRVGKKSWMRMEMYFGCDSIGDILDSGDDKVSLRNDVKYDCRKGFFSLLEKYDYKSKKVIKIK